MMEFALIVFFALWAFAFAVVAFYWRREAHSMRDQRDKVITANNKAQADRGKAIDALKVIALGKTRDAQRTAHNALQGLGLMPVVIDKDCPPDRMYFLPAGSLPVTDYY